MMRTSHQPLAHLVDAAAEKWLAAQVLPPDQRHVVAAQITAAFRLGDVDKLTFHGLRYLLTITRAPGADSRLLVNVHKIAQADA